MGLFDFLKRKKQPNIPPALQKFHATMFPGGISEQTCLTNELVSKLGGVYNSEYVSNNYIFVLTCLLMNDDKTLLTVTNKVKSRMGNRLTDSEIKLIYDFAIEHNEKLSTTMGILNLMDGLCDKGPEIDMFPEGYGEFGKVVTNPIPVRGVYGAELYLKSLRIDDGTPVKWEREGAHHAENITHIIDKYNISNAAGQFICSLFICPYCKKNSSYVPRGFNIEGGRTNGPTQGRIMPDKGVSYVVSDTGDPQLVFFREKARLFVNTPLGNETKGFFLNIRRPLVIDVTGQERVDIPQIPSQCDGIIMTGYGVKKNTAYVVRDLNSQTMPVDLDQRHDAPRNLDAHVLVFGADWAVPSKRLRQVFEERGFTSYTYIDVDTPDYDMVSDKYQVPVLPTTLVIGTDGREIQRWAGDEDEKILRVLLGGRYNILPYQIKPENSTPGIKNAWPLIAFAKTHGKMKVGTFVNKETGEEFKSCVFIDPNNPDDMTNKTFVAFSSKMGELTPSQIAAEKDNLKVVELESGTLVLCRIN